MNLLAPLLMRYKLKHLSLGRFAVVQHGMFVHGKPPHLGECVGNLECLLALKCLQANFLIDVHYPHNCHGDSCH